MSLNREKALKAKGVKKKAKGHIYKGSTGDALAQKQAAPKREYMAAKEKRDAKKAKAVGAAEAEKKKILASQEAEAKKSAEAGPFMSKEEAEAAGIMNTQRQAKNKKDLEAADKKISDAGKLTEFEKGTEKAIEVLGEEGLGRLGEKESIQEVISESKKFREKAEMGTGLAQEQLDRAKGLTSRYEKMANEGISTEAREAMRTKMAQQMGQASQMAGLRAGAALGGMRGAGAAAQQRSLMGQAMMGRAGIERDIFLQSEAAKERGLAGMGAALGGERGALAGVQQGISGERAALGDVASRVGQIETFDIGQASAEKELIGRLGLSFEQMKSQERAAEMAAQAQIQSSKGGGKK